MSKEKRYYHRQDGIIRWATDYALDIIRFNLYYNELKEKLSHESTADT